MTETEPRSHALHFYRSVLLLLLGMAGFLALMAALDLFAGIPFRIPARFGLLEAMHFNNLMNRNLNQLVAVVFMTVAIAVPLTANMYSLRFLEFFIRDPVNGFALLLVVVVDTANTWAGYRMRDGAVTAVELHVLLRPCSDVRRTSAPRQDGLRRGATFNHASWLGSWLGPHAHHAVTVQAPERVSCSPVPASHS